ncbi:hypothetical protein W97_08349 [Coniosporium apollinis CBS 100218]|uniref:Uncharacterized protein n=1 Tax=Coniosporium apollinis (strain CBS 100218) TaxID=1168221 RepID=R7Z530_CONA1|nr:uncharacterized protein W97_08349 [Coniosporium apollinis CBS 100218]EON69036.1 hypothetical protein W97_08349 [Coniosporium apollinis CBS 100218]
MFLSLLTADAAASHGHEFSSSRPSSPDRRSPIPRVLTPLSILSYGARAKTPPLSVTTSALNTESIKQNNDSMSQHRAISFAEPEPRESDSTYTVQSRPTTSSGEVLDDQIQNKRLPRSKTCYCFGHPPSNKDITQKLHLQSKLVLQLQQLYTSPRPKPAYEVFPSALLAVNLKKKYAQEFKSRDKLGIEDLVVVTAEDYKTAGSDEGDDDEGWAAREVFGCICVSKKEEAGTRSKIDIILEDNVVWEARSFPSGAYEFKMTDSHGLNHTARWLPRKSKPERSSKDAGRTPSAPVESNKRFAFSILDPSSRRHPIVATMATTGIDISDWYIMPSPASATTSPTSPAQSPLSDESEPDQDFNTETTTTSDPVVKTTEDSLRKLIIVTGIWVAFCENWSPTFRYSLTSPASTNQSSMRRLANRPSPVPRSASMPTGFGSASRPATPDSTITRSSFAKILHSAGAIVHRSTASATSILSTSPPPAPGGSGTRSQRANTASTASSLRTSSLPDRVTSAPSPKKKVSQVIEGQKDGPADEANTMEMVFLSGEGATESDSDSDAEASTTTAEDSTSQHTPARAPKAGIPITDNIRALDAAATDEPVPQHDAAMDSSPETARCYPCRRRKAMSETTAGNNAAAGQREAGFRRLLGFFRQGG